ncbi:unnamed protein product, partial [Scytosiphon promiscuus]
SLTLLAAVCSVARRPQKRAQVLGAFRSGEVSTLTNCGVLTEGFDAPFCDTIVM